MQTVNIDTTQLAPDGTGSLQLVVTAESAGLPAPGTTNTNKVMDLTWTLTLYEPSDLRARLDVVHDFTFTETVTPSPTRTAELQSGRSMPPHRPRRGVRGGGACLCLTSVQIRRAWSPLSRRYTSKICARR